MPLEKATIINLETGAKIKVQFNPEEYSVSGENEFALANVPGRSGPLLQFAYGKLRTLEMELFFDTYEDRINKDVRVQTSMVVDLLDINPQTHAPPVLLFLWGQLRFRCVLAKANQRYIMFLPTGVPVRAKVQVTFQKFTNGDFETKEVKRETADYTQLYVVGERETLSGVAAAVYSDPRQWRPLAVANNLDDPRSLPVGLRLVVPSLPYQDPETGEVLS
jgi:Contractile injection system tube protein/LysM domain